MSEFRRLHEALVARDKGVRWLTRRRSSISDKESVTTAATFTSPRPPPAFLPFPSCFSATPFKSKSAAD